MQEEQRKDVDIGRTVPPPRAAAPAPPNKDIGADDAVLDEEIAAFLARGAEDRDAEKRRTLGAPLTVARCSSSPRRGHGGMAVGRLHAAVGREMSCHGLQERGACPERNRQR